MCSPKIAGLIIAAGYSSRMGTFKPLMPLGEKTVIEAAIDSLRLGGITDIRVIVGHRAAEICQVLAGLPVVIVENPRYAEGMFSSIVTGLSALTNGTEAFFLLPGDTPLIRRQSIKAMIRAYRKTKAAVVYPVFAGQRGHPPLISAKCFTNIRNSDGTGGLRSILAQYSADSVEVELADEGILLDIDTLEDYERLKQFQLRRHIPTYNECLSILFKYKVSDKVLSHGRAVAAVGRRLAELLNDTGLNLNIEMVVAGGLLHDLAKSKPNHSKRGARVARVMGFDSIEPIIAAHMDLELAAECVIDETAVVFLADKLVQGDKVVPLAERFSQALDKFAGSPEKMNSILRRKRTAEAIWNQAARVLGTGRLEEIMVL